MLAGNDRVAGRQALRRQNISEFAVLIFDERDEGGAVWIVFDPFDLGRHIELAALEVDLAIGLLMAAPAIARGNMAVVVAAAGRIFALGERLDRLAGVQTRAVDQHTMA